MHPSPDPNKNLLWTALHRANNAVFFDHRQYWADAILAYGESYSLLGQVMTTGLCEEDRMKIEAVRDLYKRRIYELRDFASQAMHGLRKTTMRM